MFGALRVRGLGLGLRVWVSVLPGLRLGEGGLEFIYLSGLFIIRVPFFLLFCFSKGALK